MHFCIYRPSRGRTPSSNGGQALKRTDLQPRKRRNKKKKRTPSRNVASHLQNSQELRSRLAAVSCNTKQHGFMRFATATEISDEKIEEKGRGIERLLARAQQPCEESALQSNRRERDGQLHLQSMQTRISKRGEE